MTGADLLDEVTAFLRRFVAFPDPEPCLTAVTLWATHTHASEAFYVSPRLVLDSAEPESGKTRVLEVLNLLCRNPEPTISATTAAIFRMIAEEPITLLFDEVDAIFNPRNGGNYEDLRSLLNAGYKRGARIARCVGDAKAMKVQRFAVFSPVALAGIAGNMPATITTRAITIHMRRRAPREYVEQFRERYVSSEAADLAKRVGVWCQSIADELAAAEPTMPAGVTDRTAENWEALLAIADAAGGAWPGLAREACEHFVSGVSERRSFGQRLLADVRTVFGGQDRMATFDIITALIKMDESPYADMWGKPIDSVRLAKELGKYEVQSTQIKINGQNLRGYSVDPSRDSVGLADAWTRYLPRPHFGATGATGATAQVTTGAGAATPVLPPATGSTR